MKGPGENRHDPLERLLGPDEPEVSCEACFELLDEYVDLELAGADADSRIPGLRAHLAGCPACREDHESLRALVAAEPETDRQV
jgi:anti-sigma factor RsiW